MREILFIAIALILVVVAVIYLTTYEHYDQVGIASWYGPGFHGKRTANGEIYDMYAYTAAHPTLPFGAIVKVVNLETKEKKSVVVRINDRGPFVKGRIIDLSFTAAQEIGMIEKGTARVGLKIIRSSSDP